MSGIMKSGLDAMPLFLLDDLLILYLLPKLSNKLPNNFDLQDCFSVSTNQLNLSENNFL